MLGNFSFGDYFKEEAIEFAWELSLEGFGFDPEQIWISVFGGDEELGLGPDTEAIEIWRSHGVPGGADRRAAALARTSGRPAPSAPAAPARSSTSTAARPGAADDRPGGENDRYLEYWNLVFTAYELHEDGTLSELPAKNIDTGLGLERMAVIQQGVETVFDTDLLRPLIELAVELSGRPYDGDDDDRDAGDADHRRPHARRGPADRRRRRPLQRAPRLRAAADHAPRDPPGTGARPRAALPRALRRAGDRGDRRRRTRRSSRERDTIMRWIRSEEENFGRTLDRGSQLLEKLIADAERAGHLLDRRRGRVPAPRHLRLPLRPDPRAARRARAQRRRRRLRGADGVPARARPQRRRGGAAIADRHDEVIAFVGSAPETRFVGYEDLGTADERRRRRPRWLSPASRWSSSRRAPSIAEGGGQVADAGVLRWNGSEAEVVDVYRVGDDQALRVRGGVPDSGSRVEAAVGRVDRHATMRNHTATHLLHAALRERLGTHVRQAGSAVRPDKLRFDFTHGERLGADDLEAIADRVNGWIKESAPVRAIEMDRSEAERLGAMALFGEKYGDWVRMVEVEGVSRELCGGTHVANTGEIGIFAIVSEGSSASNVRRIEAITGPAAIDLVPRPQRRAVANGRGPGIERRARRRRRASGRAAARARARRLGARGGRRRRTGRRARRARPRGSAGWRSSPARSARSARRSSCSASRTRFAGRLGDAAVVLGRELRREGGAGRRVLARCGRTGAIRCRRGPRGGRPSSVVAVAASPSSRRPVDATRRSSTTRSKPPARPLRGP